jgi:hypothetical protein
MLSVTNKLIMLSVAYVECRLLAYYAGLSRFNCCTEYHYAKYHYAKCRFAECRGALIDHPRTLLKHI